MGAAATSTPEQLVILDCSQHARLVNGIVFSEQLQLRVTNSCSTRCFQRSSVQPLSIKSNSSGRKPPDQIVSTRPCVLCALLKSAIHGLIMSHSAPGHTDHRSCLAHVRSDVRGQIVYTYPRLLRLAESNNYHNDAGRYQCPCLHGPHKPHSRLWR